MNIGFYMCIVLVPIFWLIALLFLLLKGKAAGLMAGFNSLPREEQESYDKKRIAADAGKQFLCWSVLMLAGAGLCLLIHSCVAIFVYGVWFVLFFKNVHLTAEKAFEKYKL